MWRTRAPPSPDQKFRSYYVSAHAPALLALADGSVFHGKSIGAETVTTGEVVFNTALTGYQEILTDPSYCQQIVTLTYPHIGNTGVNAEDVEASRVHAAGLIIKDLPLLASNFRSTETLSQYLSAKAPWPSPNSIPASSPAACARRARRTAASWLMAGEVHHRRAPSRRWPRRAPAWPAPTWPRWSRRPRLTHGRRPSGNSASAIGEQIAPRFHVVAYDFGVKHNILRMLSQRGCKITVVPAQTPASDVFKLKPNGVFLSNGPGDPEPCDYAIAAIARDHRAAMPTFGICLGHQILALASGAKTFKMKFGHHGANHPVKDLDNGRVCITSQNHGFAVDEKTLAGHAAPHAREPVRRHLQGLAAPTSRPSASRATRKPRPARTTSARYLFDRSSSRRRLPSACSRWSRHREWFGQRWAQKPCKSFLEEGHAAGNPARQVQDLGRRDLQHRWPPGTHASTTLKSAAHDGLIQLMQKNVPAERMQALLNTLDPRPEPQAGANREPCPKEPTSNRPHHRRRPHHHRPGLRVRLLRRAGLQGAA
jgi:carbamoyl-phosphate synthase small subunit